MSEANAPEARIFLFGDPVAHSLSPLIHGTALAAVGLSWRYEAVRTGAGDLEKAVAQCRLPDVAGANLTIPHKQSVLPLLDRVSPVAKAIGAVNVIFSGDEGTLEGDNTDAAGFTAPILARGGLPKGSWVLVWGAGGAARAVVHACIHMLGAERVFVASRSMDKAARLAQEMDAVVEPGRPSGAAGPGGGPRGLAGLGGPGGGSGGSAVTPLAWDRVGDVAGDCALLVNATPLGMYSVGGEPAGIPSQGMHSAGVQSLENESPLEDLGLLRPQTIVYDLVYAPARTHLLQQAERAGAQTIGGLEMLIAQAAPAFERWTGHPFPVEAVRTALASAGSESR